MGAAKTNIEALLMKHVLLNGEDQGTKIELEVESLPDLADLLQVDYSALMRRLKQTELFQIESLKIVVTK